MADRRLLHLGVMKMKHIEPADTQQRLMEFIRKEFHPQRNHYNVSKLIGDASARQYFRYVSESGESFILAAYPEPFDPKHFSYRQVYDLFRKIGLPVPTILAADGRLGIVLQEDLGDESLQRHLLSADESERKTLLCRAIDHVVKIQSRGTPALDPEQEASKLAFDQERLSWELFFFKRNYLCAYRNLEPEDERLAEEFNRMAAELAGLKRFLCHRDYHVRNLMVKGGELYIIDFQDSRLGPLCYDLVSLLKDSIELEPEEIEQYQRYYLEAIRSTWDSAPELTENFERQFQLMCIQRLLKALGTYGFQIVERGHFIYEQYIPGSLHRALLSLQAVGEFPYIQAVVEQELIRK